MVFISHVLLPVIFPSEASSDPIRLSRFDRVAAVIVRTEVLDRIIVYAVIVSFEVFWGREAFAALLTLFWTNMVLLVTPRQD